MNYLLPVIIGAPDYKYYKNCFTTNKINKNNFCDFNNSEKKDYKQFSHNNFSYYLTGLWEGDGHIWIPKTSHAPCGKKYIPHFTITFDKRDIILCLHLQKILGGTVVNKNSVNACTLTINSKKGLINIIKLINGKLRTPKITKFSNLIVWINVNYDTNFNILGIDTTNIISNAWLSGFIDADGSFNLNIRQKSEYGGKNRVESRFRIEQRISDPITNISYKYIIESIACAFIVNCKISQHNIDKSYYSVCVSSPKKLIKLIEYLTIFPLFSSKYINFLDFKDSVNIILNKEHLKSQNKFISIKNNINNRRTIFNWNHLDNLFN